MPALFHISTYRFKPSARRGLRTALLAIFGLVAVTTGFSGCFGAISGCNGNSEQQALTLANQLHAKMAQGDLAGIYDDAAQRYRDAVTREKSDALFSSVARKLGSPQNCKQGITKYEVTTNGTMIESQCETTFSKDATGVETFTWLKSGNEFRLLGYHINSDALIER
jgi:hypothetical protein